MYKCLYGTVKDLQKKKKKNPLINKIPSVTRLVYVDYMYTCLHGTVKHLQKKSTFCSMESPATEALFTVCVCVCVCVYGIVKDQQMTI
jgi:hypothetical protein